MDDLILHCKHALALILARLSNGLLLLLGQQEVVLSERSTSDLLAGSLTSISFTDKNSIWILQKSQADRARLSIVVGDLVDASLEHHGLNEAAFDSDPDLIYHVLEARVVDIDLRSVVLD